MEPLSQNGNRKKTRSYVFTGYWDEPIEFSKKMKYLLYAPEVCPTTGRPHWQGFVVWKSQRSISAIQKEYKKKNKSFGFLEAERGEFSDQKAYIIGPYDDGKGKTKPHNPDYKEFGTPPNQGKRTDLVALKDKLVAGTTTVDDICLTKPMMYHKYGRTLQKIEDIMLRKRFRSWMTKGIWLWGKTGVGKSHKAFENFDPDTCYLWKDDNGWQDGYTGQETVIINDFRAELRYNELLQMIDKWPYTVRRRGREPAPFLAKTVIITSSLPPGKVYNKRVKEDSLNQLLRRLNVVEVTPECLEKR